MLTSRIIPCLDTRNGRVVKGVKFQNLRDAGCPAERARSYEQQGADEVVMLDVSATPEGRATAVETVRTIRAELSIPLTVGGGVRSEKNAGALLEAGADKVGINTAAVDNPDLLTRISNDFGRQCTIIAIDAARRPEDDGWEVVIHSGKTLTGIDALDWAEKSTDLGAGEILLTSWDKDGTRSGYDLELLSAVSSRVQVPVIASGGAATPQHLVDALKAGADAVLAASIFHDGDYTVNSLKQELSLHGVQVRL